MDLVSVTLIPFPSSRYLYIYPWWREIMRKVMRGWKTDILYKFGESSVCKVFQPIKLTLFLKIWTREWTRMGGDRREWVGIGGNGREWVM